METSADLNRLLLWLAQNSENGARQYVEMRQKLVNLFRFRGCESPEDLADETLDRSARAIRKPEFVFEGNPIAYLRGVAHNVYLESLRKPHTVSQESLPELPDIVADERFANSGIEPLHFHLDRCLARLPKDKRDLLLRYYQGEKSAKIDGRLRLAHETGIELNTLRIQIFRLRNMVRKCVESCMKATEMKLPI